MNSARANMNVPRQLPNLYSIYPRDGFIGATTVDIIAVHGIETTSPRTWTYRQDKVTDGSGVNWLSDEDMLPGVVPQARIWVFDYNSNYTESAQEVYIGGVGETLLKSIEHEDTLGKRPLVFIGSCFGGLVVAQALENASRERSTYQYLIHNTVGVIFLGTPLRGTSAWKYADWLALVSTIMGREASRTLIKDLETSSSTLETLVNNFGKMTVSEGLQIQCFYETRPTQIFKAVFSKRLLDVCWPSKELLVEQRSACLDCHDQIPLEVPHVMMNKFSGPQDGSFRLVSGRLKIMFDKASVVNKRTAEERACLQLLTSNYREDKDRNNERVVNTCKWFLEHPKFNSWRREKSENLLWVSADPGYGKSVLSRALVDEGHLSIHGENPSICYFFFKDDNASRQNTASALCAILHQLFVQEPMLLKHAMLDYAHHGQNLRTMPKTLWEILLKAASDPQAGEILCLFDALDECQKSAREDLIEWIGNFFSTRDRNITRLKFLVTSRPYFEIERKFTREFGDTSLISLRGEEESEKISEEVNLVIDDQVTIICRERGFAPKVQKLLIEHLKDMKQRTYLWLHFVLEAIRETLHSMEARLKKLLEVIPLDVDDAYEKILQRATDPQARTLLNIIVAADSPLTLQEMNIALAIDERLESGELCRSHRDLDLEPEERFRTKVRNICGLFVTIVDSKIYLIHQTAKEFLMGTRSTDQAVNPTYPGLGRWKHSLNLIQSNLILVKVCLSYLHFDEFESESESESESKAESDIPTYKTQGSRYVISSRYTSPRGDLEVYAWRNWVSHFRVAQNIADQSLLHLALGFCDPQTDRFKKHSSTYLGYTAAYSFNDLDHTSLTTTSFLGLQALVKLLLEEHGVDVDSEDGEGRTALTCAAKRGHIDVVQLLVQSGAKLDFKDMTGRTPLSWAAAHGKLDVVQMLLNEGAALNSKDDQRRTPLLHATCGHNAIEDVQLFLEKGAEYDSRDNVGLTPLSWAAERLNGDVLKWLIIKGARCNSKDNTGRSPLSYAAGRFDSLEVVQLLLEGGATPESKDNLGRTPLSWAAQVGNVIIVKELLESGAECESRDNWERTPISYAAAAVESMAPEGNPDGYGPKEVVRLLLQKGAKCDSRDSEGRTPSSWAAENGSPIGNLEQLLENGAECDSRDNWGRTPLSYAAAARQQTGDTSVKAVRLLLQKGAKCDSRDSEGRTPLSWAAENGSPVGFFKELLKNGAECDSRDNWGRTPLSYAAADADDVYPFGNSVKVIRLLLQKGASCDSRDSEGRTPLSYAIDNKREKHADLIRAKLALHS